MFPQRYHARCASSTIFDSNVILQSSIGSNCFRPFPTVPRRHMRREACFRLLANGLCWPCSENRDTQNAIRTSDYLALCLSR